MHGAVPVAKGAGRRIVIVTLTGILWWFMDIGWKSTVGVTHIQVNMWPRGKSLLLPSPVSMTLFPLLLQSLISVTLFASIGDF